MRLWVIIAIFLLVTGCANSHNFAPVDDGTRSVVRRSSHDFSRQNAYTRNNSSNSLSYKEEMPVKEEAENSSINGRAGRLEVVNLKESASNRAKESPHTQEKMAEENRETDRKTEVSKETEKPEITETSEETATSSETRGWIWPAEGKVRRDDKGINIAGDLNAPVVSVADGVVSYAGSGLAGYGKLLIIKHQGDLLTAYAHNNQVLVHEGEKIKKGQKIALMGRTEQGAVQLHFEVRRDGKAQNPLQFLPKRSPS